MHYRPEIDGLRAVAVLSVIFFHAGFSVFSGGFVGVDIFFVISGYLITTIILTEMEQEKFSLLRFYERRARRIFPALFLVMIISLGFAWYLYPPFDLKPFSESLLATLSFSSNVFYWSESGYWNPGTELMPLLNTWSLAIEEQYYILFPLFLMLMWHYKKHLIFNSLILIIIISFSIAEWGAYNKPSAAFYLLPARAWELAMGAALAFFLVYKKNIFRIITSYQIINECFGVLGFLMIIYSVIVFNEKTPFPSSYTLAPTIGTILIIIYALPTTIIGKLLNIKIFVNIGLISYSLYLWHQPVFAFSKYRSSTELSDLSIVILTSLLFPLAYLSWKFVETPFRSKCVFSKRSIFLFSVIFSLFFLIIGLTIYNTNGLEKYWLNKTSEVTQITYRLIQRDFIPNKAPENSLTCRFRIDILDEKTTKKITLCNRKHGKGYAILGDSHATDLFNSVISTNTYPFIIGITKGGCRLSGNVSPSKCNFNEFFSYIKHNKNIFHGLIYEQAGFTLLKTKKEKGNRVMFNQKGEKETIKNIYINVDSVNKTYKHLYKMSKYIKVIWFGSRVEPHITKRIIIKNGCDYEFKLRPNQKEVFKKLDTYIKTLDFNKNNLSFISQNNTFNYQFPDDFMSCKALYWSDGDHLSTSGEKRFGERFDILGLFSH